VELIGIWVNNSTIRDNTGIDGIIRLIDTTQLKTIALAPPSNHDVSNDAVGIMSLAASIRKKIYVQALYWGAASVVTLDSC
jgi:hypothetical protein